MPRPSRRVSRTLDEVGVQVEARGSGRGVGSEVSNLRRVSRGSLRVESVPPERILSTRATGWSLWHFLGYCWRRMVEQKTNGREIEPMPI